MAHSTAAAFLQAILEQPDDDAPRLIFADWLEENGDTERAEFIRVQIELARMPDGDRKGAALRKREAALLKVHKQRWLGLLHAVISDGEFRRGFLEKAVFKYNQFSGHVDSLLNSTPLRSLGIVFRSMMFSDRFDAALAELAKHPRVSLIEELDLSAAGLSEASIGGLARSEALTNLRSLNLMYCETGPGALKALMHSPTLRHLQELRLGSEWDYQYLECLDDEAIQGLMNGPRWHQLTALHVSQPRASESSLVRLIESPNSQLRTLKLRGCRCNGRTVQALIERPERAARWRHLSLVGNSLKNKALLPLAQSPHLTNLATLDLRSNEASLMFARALAKSPSLQALTRLELGGNPIPAACDGVLEKRFGAGVCRFT
jgi:uncharacterized protein (TIGR02996 family)